MTECAGLGRPAESRDHLPIAPCSLQVMIAKVAMARNYEHWPYSAVIAWGMWRTKSALLRAWMDDENEGILAGTMREAEAVANLFPDETKLALPFADAEAALLEALVSGRVSSTGTSPRYPDRDRMPIPAEFWKGAKVAAAASADIFIARDEHGTGWTPFRDILLDARGVLRVFEKHVDPDSLRAPTQLRRFFCEYLLDQHEGRWPSMAYKPLLSAFLKWVKDEKGKTIADQLDTTQPSTLQRFHKNKRAFADAMQWVIAKTQR